jgi:DNA-binding PadR family transcriptional regulator
MEVIMSGSFKASGFSASDTADSVWQTMEDLRSKIEKRVSTRMGRGDVRSAVLALLTEQPMHGYQIIREIEERTDGSWKPSAGSVYPTLQLLADEELISAQESNGRKTYTLTEAGRAEAEAPGASAPWEANGPREGAKMSALPKAGIDLAQAVSQVGRSGSTEQVEQTIAILEDARRQVYGILAKQ